MIFTSKRIIIISASFILVVMLIKLFISIKQKNKEIKVLKCKYNKCKQNNKCKCDKYKSY